MYRLNLKPARLAAALLFCLALPAAAYNSREVESISSRLDLLEEEPLQKSTEAALIQQLDEINGYISRLADCEETARSELNKLKDIKNLPAGLKEQQKTHTGQMLACQSLQKRAIDLRRSFGLAIDRHSFKRYKSRQSGVIDAVRLPGGPGNFVSFEDLHEHFRFELALLVMAVYSLFWWLARLTARRRPEDSQSDLLLILLFLATAYVAFWFNNARDGSLLSGGWYVMALGALLYRSHRNGYTLHRWLKGMLAAGLLTASSHAWMSIEPADMVQPVWLDSWMTMAWAAVLYWVIQPTSSRSRLVAVTVCLLIVLFDVAGYHQLAHQLIVSLMSVKFAWLGYGFILVLIPELLSLAGRAGRLLPPAIVADFGLDKPLAGSRWLRWSTSSLGLIWLTVTAMPYSGLPRHYSSLMSGFLLSGFTLGTISISPAALVMAMLVFGILVSAGKIIQERIENQPVARHGRGSAGNEAIASIFWYSAMTTSALIALSVAGFSVQNLALIAGAFSIGIGFGLQNIVSNFVSGLILLIERPIKRGDWVVIGNTEGFVKKVKIRATEIQTFDKADIIVPNSDLISNQVTNWMLNDRIGRLKLQVGVAYGSDVERVKKILEEAAFHHPGVITDNSHYNGQVLFMAFGESSLDFEIRAYLKDISDIYSVKSDINFEINRRFKEEGIEIPFPQRDLHIRSDATRPALREETQPPAGKPPGHQKQPSKKSRG